jgi:GST-like protein
MTGNFGHFMVYAPDGKVETRDYGVARYGMEAQRLCDVLDKQLDGKKFICGDEYTIADMMCLPWFDIIRTTGYTHPSGVGAKDFLTMERYENLFDSIPQLESDAGSLYSWVVSVSLL